jgi:hypothetical protein
MARGPDAALRAAGVEDSGMLADIPRWLHTSFIAVRKIEHNSKIRLPITLAMA